MCADPSVPLKLAERAAIESATLLHDTDLPDFGRFVDDVRNQASAFAASAGVPQFPSGGAVYQPVQAPVLTASQPQSRTQAEALATDLPAPTQAP